MKKELPLWLFSNRPNLQNWHGLALINSDRPIERRIVLGGLRFVKLSGVGLMGSDWPFYTFDLYREYVHWAPTDCCVDSVSYCRRVMI